MEANSRIATFAGRFYPNNANEAKKMINAILASELGKIQNKHQARRIIGGIVPHAGWVYSANHAVHVYELLKEGNTPFDTVVIVNPNHTGFGNSPFNVGNWDFWETPLGKIEIDKEFSDLLEIQTNNDAHSKEHSGEVQLPLIQEIIGRPLKLVMITMNIQSSDNAKLLASKIFEAKNSTKKNIILLASSDFTHFENPLEGQRKDQLVFEQIIAKNTLGIEQVVKENNLSVCGFGPIMTLIEFSKLQSTQFQVDLLSQGNSGEVYPSEKVVGYASFLCTTPRIDE